MSVSRKETLLVIKQRIASLGLGLALLGSLVGFAGTANAATDGDGEVIVTASTTDVLTISVNPGTINFGTMDFLGNGGVDVQDRCQVTNGARYISPNVRVEVSSSQNYTVDRGVYPNGGDDMFELLDSTLISPGTYQGGCSTPQAAAIDLNNTFFENNGQAGKNIVDHEFFIIEVLAGEPASNYNVRLVYSAQQS
jgi:hypothetical protein